MAQVVETTIANNVTGMEEISKLINKVGELDQEQKRVAAAMLQVKAAGDKLTKSTHNVASATKAQAAAANELRNRLDPMFAAQKRFNQQMDEADRLYEAGIISLKEYTAAQKQARDALRQHAQAVQNGSASVKNGTNDLDAQSKVFRRNRQAMQMAGMQIGDFATQVTSGTSPVQAFNQQIGQLGYALSTSARPRLAAVGNFLAGPWSIAVLGATMILGPMIEEMLGLGEASGNTKKSLSDLVEEKRAAFRQTEVTKQAEEAYKKTIEGVREAILANKKALGELNEAKQTSAEKALKEARANLANIRTLEAEHTARLLNVKAMAQAQMQRAISAGAGSEIAAMGLAEAYRRVSEAEMDALKVSMDFVDAMNQVNSAERAVSAERIRYSSSTDAATRATQALTESMDLAQLMIADGTLSASEGAQQMIALAEAKKRVEEAAKESGRATKEIKSEMDKFLESIVKADNRLELARQAFLAGAISASQYRTEIEKAEKAERQFAKVPIAKILALRGNKPLQLFQGPFDVSPLEEFNREQEKVAKEAENIRSSYEAIGNAVANGFKGMITGAQSFGSAMKSIIQSVIDELFRLYVVQQIVGFVTGALGGIFGGGAAPAGGGGSGFGSPRGFAAGGYPAPGKVALVGERGPELFVPTSSGKIIPNHQMGGGGGMVINGDARGSSDPEAVRQQVQQGILEAAPSIVAAAQNRTINTLRRPRLAGAL